MKSKLASYLAGVLTALTVTALPIAARAADGALTLAITPSRMEINGEAFQPKDGLIFVADGIAYAPVQEFAGVLGLESSYDEVHNLISIVPTFPDPGTASGGIAPEDFTSQWAVRQKPVTDYGDEKIFTATYSGALCMSDFKEWWKNLGPEAVSAGAEQLAAEAQGMVGGKVTMYFDYSGYALGTAYARGGFETSNFDAAGVWIK